MLECCVLLFIELVLALFTVELEEFVFLYFNVELLFEDALLLVVFLLVLDLLELLELFEFVVVLFWVLFLLVLVLFLLLLTVLLVVLIVLESVFVFVVVEL